MDWLLQNSRSVVDPLRRLVVDLFLADLVGVVGFEQMVNLV